MDIEMLKQQREELRLQWVSEGCQKQFIEWLLDRVEAAVKKS